jgi:hypothetical protein
MRREISILSHAAKLSVAFATAAAIFGASHAASAQSFPTCPTTPLDPTGALCASLDGIFNKIPTTPDRCTADPSRNAPSHFKGDFTVDGPYTFDAAKIADKYRGVTPDKFGTTDVKLPGGGVNNVRDLHYAVGDGKIGMRPIPVSDTGTVTAPDGTQVSGSKVMDDFLRKTMGLGPNDPIFALIAYQHPEENNGTLEQVGKDMLKTEGGETHLGAYIGNGATRNSPEGYHNHVWENAGYPATVQMVSMKGTPQGTLNQSFENASAILNAGVKFPGDYKNDVYKTIDLKTTLAFYEGWLTDEDKLKTDQTWFTYCAEHQTIVTNIGLNVPSNLAAYQEIWGAEKGAKLFDLAKAKYTKATGKPFVETSFEPLYKKDGITDPTNETTIGKGLAWAPETTADLVTDFLSTYASFPDVGAPTSAAMALGFMPIVMERMGITQADYMKIALPILNKMMIGDALTQDFAHAPAGPAAAMAEYLKQKTAQVYVGVGGNPTDFAPGGTIDSAKMALAQTIMAGLTGHAADVVAHSGLCKDQAWDWFRKAIEPELTAARNAPVAPGKVQFNSPPAVTHRIASGMLPHDPNVSITEIATAMDGSELKLK